jgi:hypothetical protein
LVLFRLRMCLTVSNHFLDSLPSWFGILSGLEPALHGATVSHTRYIPLYYGEIGLPVNLFLEKYYFFSPTPLKIHINVDFCRDLSTYMWKERRLESQDTEPKGGGGGFENDSQSHVHAYAAYFITSMHMRPYYTHNSTQRRRVSGTSQTKHVTSTHVQMASTQALHITIVLHYTYAICPCTSTQKPTCYSNRIFTFYFFSILP